MTFWLQLTVGVYTKHQKSDTLYFSTIFMTLGTQKLQKNHTLVFYNFHDPGYTKHQKNDTLYFSTIFMTPDTQKLQKKIRRFREPSQIT